MTVGVELHQRKRYRAPVRHDEALIDPTWNDAEQLWHRNRSRFQQSELTIADRTISEFRQSAQAELLEMAFEYSAEYLSPHVIESIRRRTKARDNELNLLVSGHQPELFHPGVWFKNFGLSSLSDRLGVPAINMVIDNDLCTSPSISVPAGTVSNPTIEHVAFDKTTEPVPWETRRVHSESLYESFAERVQNKLIKFDESILLTQMWELATDQLLLPFSLGKRIAAARHRYESKLGLQNLEVPLSCICDTRHFREFAASILARGKQFQLIHNDSLHRYRATNRLRSQTHPVPDLGNSGVWIETPFWIWSVPIAKRRPLYVRYGTSDQVMLSDLNGCEFQGQIDELPAFIEGMKESGFVIRPRALITTMYARLVLSTLFIHGIGGAKYDQLTDLLIERFFGIQPPGYQVLTATFHLPLDVPQVGEADLRKAKWILRDMRYHPERHVDLSRASEVDSRLSQWASEKSELIASEPRETGRREWHLKLTGLNEKMQPFLESQRRMIESDLTEMDELLRRGKLLASREHSFVLHPESIGESLKRHAEQP